MTYTLATAAEVAGKTKPTIWRAVKSGKIKYREDIVKGLDAAPDAFIGLLKGRNFGKLVVKL